MQSSNHQVSLFVEVQQDDTFLHQMEIKNQFQPNKIQKEKNAHLGKTASKIRYYNLCIRFGTWKVRRLNQSRSKAEIPGLPRWEERLSRSKLKEPFLID